MNTAYQEIESVARALKQDGLDDWADRLLRAHTGIFNATELYMKWRWHLEHILRLRSISDTTRAEAERVRLLIDKQLQ
jgi:hypothetical protein